MLLYGAMAMANGIAFDPSFEQPSLVFLTNYLTFPFLIWAALRFGVRGTAGGLLLLAALALRPVLTEQLPVMFVSAQWPEAVFSIQLYLAILAVASMFLAAAVSERNASEADALKGRRWLQLAIRSANVGLWDWDLRTNRVYYSPEWKRQIGYEEPEIANDVDEWQSRIHPDDLERVLRNVRAFIENPSGDYHAEFRLRHKEGSYRWILSQASFLQEVKGEPIRMLGSHLDITERKQAEDRIRNLNRTYAVLSNINQTIVRERDLQTIFERACRIAVAEGGFRMAWIGLVEPRTKEVRPTAQAGVTDGYIEKIRIVLNGGLRGRGPTGSALQQGRHVVCNDIEHDPAMAPWRTDALKLGYRASAAFSLIVKGEARGTFNLYADRADFFREQEIELLDELAKNISFAMEYSQEEEQRRRAEQALRESETLLTETQRTAKIGGWEFDPSTLNGTWTAETARIQDVDPNIEPNVDLGVSFYHGEHRKAIERAVQEAIEFGKSYDLELEMVTAKGVHKWVRTMGQPVTEGGKITRVRGSIQDITDRKLQERALRESEERFRTAFEHSAGGMCLVGLDGTLQQVNHTLCDMLGYTKEELEGAHFNHITHPEDADIGSEVVRRLVTGEVLSAAFEKRYLRKTGETIWAHIKSVVLKGDSGEPLYFITQIEDITERKHAENEVRKLNEELIRNAAELEQRVAERTEELVIAKERAESADRLKSVFLSTMSHELRTPLNSIIGFTGILLQELAGPMNEEQTKQLRMVQGSGRHLLNLINDVLDISKIEAGQLSVAHEPFALDEEVVQVIDLITPMAEKKRLTIHTHIADDIDNIVGNRLRTGQILNNLLGNAVKFTPDGGEIHVTVELLQGGASEIRTETGTAGFRGDQVRISVQDTGIGLLSEDMETLFQPFRQIDTGMTRQFEGTGLGLSISKRLVEMLGGEIRVESDGLGKGSRFIFSLPTA